MSYSMAKLDSFSLLCYLKKKSLYFYSMLCIKGDNQAAC